MNVENFKTRGKLMFPLLWLRFVGPRSRVSIRLSPKLRTVGLISNVSITDAFADALEPDSSVTTTVETKAKKEKKTARVVTPAEGKLDVQNFKSFGVYHFLFFCCSCDYFGQAELCCPKAPLVSAIGHSVDFFLCS
jgi:hypothetical protein